jgi:hypothetical protein
VLNFIFGRLLYDEILINFGRAAFGRRIWSCY